MNIIISLIIDARSQVRHCREGKTHPKIMQDAILTIIITINNWNLKLSTNKIHVFMPMHIIMSTPRVFV